MHTWVTTTKYKEMITIKVRITQAVFTLHHSSTYNFSSHSLAHYTIPPTTWFKSHWPQCTNFEKLHKIQTSLTALQTTNHRVINRRASWSVTEHIISFKVCQWSVTQFTHNKNHVFVLPLCLPVKHPHNILPKWTTERGNWATKKKVQQRNGKS